MAQKGHHGGGDGYSRLSSWQSPPHDQSSVSSSSESPLLLPSAFNLSLSLKDPPSIEGYDLDLFNPPADEKYICPICMMVLREPVQTQCGHRFCDACIRRWTREKERCPVCNDSCPTTHMFKDNFALREIMSLRVKCANYKLGCKDVLELRQLEEHIKECPYFSIECPKGCHQSILRKNLTRHTSMECSKRDVRCRYCLKEDVSFSDLKEHESKCPEVEVQCRLCQCTYPRKMALEHKNACKQERIQCSFGLFGCPCEFLRKEEGNHMNASVVSHLNYLCKHLTLAATAKVYDVTRSVPLLPSYTSASHESSSKTDGGFFSDPSHPIFSTAGNIPILHSIRMEDSDMQLSPALFTPEQRLGFNRLGLLEDRHYSAGAGRARTFPIEEPELRKSMINLQAIVQNHEKLIGEQQQLIQRHEQTINRLESHVRDFEGRHCNGTYIWRIKDYKRRKQEAVSGKTIVHHSPGFYTSFHGYKMCIRVNLNGVESGQGTHLSLFIHLMQGEFDEILKWPFQGTITMSVLDQRDAVEQRKDITETLNAKPELAAFLRPYTKRNHKGFGYIEFAPISFIDNGCFVKNDTMLVKAVVEPSKHL